MKIFKVQIQYKNRMNEERCLFLSLTNTVESFVLRRTYLGSLNQRKHKENQLLDFSFEWFWGTIECKFLTSKDVWENIHVYMHRYNHLIVYQNVYWRGNIRIRFLIFYNHFPISFLCCVDKINRLYQIGDNKTLQKIEQLEASH